MISNKVFLKLEDSLRPIIVISTNGLDMNCLIDSGAELSTWFRDVELLQSFFPDAYDTGCCSRVTDVNGNFAYRDVWAIPEFKFSTNIGKTNTCLVVKDMLVNISPEKDMYLKREFLMMLGWNLFRSTGNNYYNLSVLFDYRHDTLEKFKSGVLHIITNRDRVVMMADVYKDNTGKDYIEECTGRKRLISSHCYYQDIGKEVDSLVTTVEDNSANIAGAFRELYKGKK